MSGINEKSAEELQSEIDDLRVELGRLRDDIDGKVFSIRDFVPQGVAFHADRFRRLMVKRKAVSDTNYTAELSDAIVGFTSITAARTVTLPGAAEAGEGKILIINDESGSVTSDVAIIVDAKDTEYVDDTLVKRIEAARGELRIYSTGVKWHSF